MEQIVEQMDEAVARTYHREMNNGKIINKAYRLTEDLSLPPNDVKLVVDIFKKWISDGSNPGTREEMEAQVRSTMRVLAKKGDLFFRAHLFMKDDGTHYLYPANVSAKILNPLDSLLYVESNKLRLWQLYLQHNDWLFSYGKFEEVETEEFNFEQIHIVAVCNEIKAAQQKIIDAANREIKILNEYIHVINRGN